MQLSMEATLWPTHPEESAHNKARANPHATEGATNARSVNVTLRPLAQVLTAVEERSRDPTPAIRCILAGSDVTLQERALCSIHAYCFWC